MKRVTSILLIALLAAALVVLAGCDGETTEASEPTAEDISGATTTVQDAVQPAENGVEDEDMADEGLPQATPGLYTDLTPEQAKQLIDSTPDLVILDVSPIYADGHLPGAINYYIGDGSLEAALPSLDMSVPYLVYCHTDSASIGGAELLVAAGFPEVYRLEGNYSAWVAAGYDVEQ